MKHTITHRTGLPAVALLTVVAAALAGYPMTADAFAAAQVPTLTNEVGQPAGGAEPQLVLGIALLAIGLVGLAIGLAAYSRRSAASARVRRREIRGLMRRTS